MLFSRQLIRITTHFYIVSGRKVDASVVSNRCGPHLRSFRIHKNGDRIRDGSYIRYNFIESFSIQMG